MSRWISQLRRLASPLHFGEQPTDAQYIKLNTNESPFSPLPRVAGLFRAEASS